ncbi:MAG: hypothetical protein WCH43_00400 [Verrucomicrobiota bacterium]
MQILLHILAALSLVATGGFPAASSLAAVPAQDLPGDWAKVVDDPAKTLDLEWMGPLGYERALPGSWLQSRVEKLFNVKIHPIFLDPVAYEKTRALHFVAGDIPDLFWDGDPRGVRRKVKHGFVLELPYEVLLRYAPNYVAYVNANGPEAWMYSYSQGRNWGIPTVVPAGAIPLVAVWREDWLKNVGITKIPKTLPEFHEAFRRFTFNDPDGNGRRDTYGLSPCIEHWSFFFIEFFAQKGVLPFDLQEVDGKMTWGGIRPEAREVLAMLRDWYAEGIIDPDFVLGLRSETHMPLQNGRVGYYGLGTYDRSLERSRPDSVINRMAETHPEARLAAGPLMEGPDGQHRNRVWGGGGHVLQFSANIPKEKVVRVLWMLDGIFADPKLAIEINMGRRGLHWDYTPEQGVFALDPYTGKKATQEMIGVHNFLAPSFFGLSGLSLEAIDSLRSESQRKAERLYSRPEWGIANALGKTDVLESASDSIEDLYRMQVKFFVDIIRGKRPLDDFAVFVELWKKRGGDRLLEEAEVFRKERQEVYSKVGVSTGGSR